MDRICSNCSYMKLLKIRENYEAYCCMAHTIKKGGTEYEDPKGVLPYFKCNCGKFKSKDE